ncbi:MAG: hypothetical protein AAFO91_09985, partial [Bacteroidota bacterium]
MLQTLQRPAFIENDKGFNKQFTRLETILEDLNSRSIASTTSDSINAQIEEINQHTGNKASYKKAFGSGSREITTLLQKAEGLTPKAYYQTLWMSLGMAAFGLPIGLLIALSVDNWGLLAIGLPIGSAVGVILGMSFD